MPVAQPIAGVKVGASTTVVGTPEVYNARLAILPLGWESAFVGDNGLVYDATSGNVIVFDFWLPPENPPTGNFVFGAGAQTQFIRGARLWVKE